jgi:hypothetical protein
MQEKCYALETELQSCEYGELDYPPTYFVSGLVKHKQGDPTDIRVAFYAEDGTSVIRDMTPIEILETKKILPPTKMTKTPEYAIASPIVYNRDETGNLVCPMSKKMVCSKSGIPGNLCEIPTSVEDINLFVEAMGSEYDHPECPRENADFSCNGNVSFEDIEPFITILNNGWIMCNKTMICEHAGQNWTLNQTAIRYFNQTCI